MSQLEDPVRLATSGSPLSRELLRSAHLDEPSAQALERLAARLGPALAPPATAASGSAGTWLALAATGVIGVAGVLWWTRPTAPPQPVAVAARAIAPASSEPAPPTPSVAPLPPTVVATLPPPAAPAAPPTARRLSRSPVATPAVVAAPAAPARIAAAEPAPPPVALAEPLPREIDLLRGADDALGGGDARRSLTEAARHERLYPDGVMAEEREAIIIKAMLQLGERDPARARFDRFVARFPGSAYRSPLQQRLVAAGR